MAIQPKVIGGAEYDPGSGDIDPDDWTAPNDSSLGSLATKSTINDSDWSGTDLDITNGGTGASSASAARSNLGLGSVDNTADAAKAVLSATKLTTARTINDVSFDGSGNIMLTRMTGGIVTKTAAYTVGAGDGTILVDATAGAVTITLPIVAANNTRIINVKKIDASANVVTVMRNGSVALIDGASSRAISAQWANVTVHCNGTDWFVI